MNTSYFDSYYKNAKAELIKTDDSSVAVRVYGAGPNLVLVPGFPVHGYTWRKVLPKLAEHFKCFVIDLPGLGDSTWTPKTDFTFTGQAKRMLALLDKLALDQCSILAQDTGATISRLVAAQNPARVGKLVIINTEIPNHRPPWIPLYRHLAKLPGANTMFRGIFASPIVRSSMGLKGFYSDRALLNDPGSLTPYVKPLVKSAQKMAGMLNYLKGIEWNVVDGLIETHKQIKADTMILWGAEDEIFPIEYAKPMAAQFAGSCQFFSIANARLMPHEEQPEKVLQHILPFLIQKESTSPAERELETRNHEFAQKKQSAN